MKNSYKIIYKKQAKKFLEKNPKYGIRFIKNFIELSGNFKDNYKHFDIEMYKGVQNAFRMRIGGYRAIFIVDNSEIKVIEVINIGSRGDIYNK